VIKKEILLDGLDCANCALKIEDSIKHIEGVNHASVDFVTQKLNIETIDLNKFELIKDKVIYNVKKIEPDVRVVFDYENKSNETTKQGINLEIVSLVLGSIVFLTSLIIKFDVWINISLYITSILLLDGKLLFMR